ncbi:MAG: hypothetical protein WCJ61_06655 [Paludibacter sp.]
MKVLNYKRLHITISVFLLLTSFIYFAFLFFQQGEIDVLLRNELKQISANEAMSWKGLELSDEQRTMPAHNDLPSFKNKTQYGLGDISNSEVDFHNYSNLEKAAPNGSNVLAVKNVDGTTSNVANYSYAQKKSAANYISAYQNVSNETHTFQSRNTSQPINHGIQSVANFASNSPTIPNTSTNAFLANNSLSLTTDLSNNSTSMLIGGDSNPGDPGVPVGDGTWILLIMMLAYSFKKSIV